MIKKINRFGLTGLLLIICCISLSSCGYSDEDAKKYLPGIYFYRIPSGELQQLMINPDFTYKQIIYSKNKKILYENTGKMHVDGNDIKLEHWLECYKLGNEQNIESKPRLTFSTGNYWVKPKDDEDVLIVKFDQTDYIFRKNNI